MAAGQAGADAGGEAAAQTAQRLIDCRCRLTLGATKLLNAAALEITFLNEFSGVRRKGPDAFRQRRFVAAFLMQSQLSKNGRHPFKLILLQ